MIHSNSWPIVNEAPRLQGVIRQSVEDFFVNELLDFTPEGSGEHLYLKVEKENLTTIDVVKSLQKHYKVSQVDLGYAGLKDKRSISRQWFSVRTNVSSTEAAINGVKVLEQTRHTKKLRQHDAQTNQFRIKVRGEGISTVHIDIPESIPNYFGEQRFGRDGNNSKQAIDWLNRGKPKISRFLRSIYLSSLRSLVFNTVLAERVRVGNWDQAIEGDDLICKTPTAPLWGRGRSSTSGTALEIETKALLPLSEICEQLEWVGLTQSRRALSINPTNRSVTRIEDGALLAFDLPSGSYATSVIREVIDVGS